MKSFPNVSVIIPTFNYGRFLRDAIDSVLAQTYTDYEILIIDNNSTDDTDTVVKSYTHISSVKYLKNEANLGMSGNWNKALLHVTGKYIKFLCADDKLHPECLQKQVDVLEGDHSIKLVSSYFQNFGSDNLATKYNYSLKVEGKAIVKDNLLKHNIVGTPTQVMFRREDLWVGTFKTEFYWINDTDMWNRLLLNGYYYCIPEILSYLRVHESQGTQTAVNSFTAEFTEYVYLKNIQLTKQFSAEEYSGPLSDVLKRKVYNIINRFPDMYRHKRHDLIRNTFNYIHYERIYLKGYVKIIYVVLRSLMQKKK